MELMETKMVLISADQIDQMLMILQRAEGYCTRAKSTADPTFDPVRDEPTDCYPGASGYAGAAMRDVIQTLESHLV